MLRTIVWTTVLLLAASARGGDFCGSVDGPAALRALDSYAAGKGAHVHPDCFQQTYGDPLPDAVKTRILAACTKAVALAVARRSELLDSFCTLTVLTSGVGRVADRDLVGELIARPWTWDGWPPYQALAASGDARVRPFVLTQFATHRETWRRKKLHAEWARDAWMTHELRVLSALEKVGTSDDLALIGEIEADRPRDKRLAGAAKRAREAAAARKAAP